MKSEVLFTRRVILGVVILLGVIVLGYAWFNASEKSKPVRESVNLYQADVARSGGKNWDPRLLIFSPYELAQAPTSDVFVSPVGSEYGAFSYDAQPFGDKNEKRGGMHSGSDLNGIGGENTDKGIPIYAAGRGLLVYAGEPSPAWGKVVVLLHRLPNGNYVQTIYAHLDSIEDLYLGSLVARGEKIGTMGDAGGNYYAHLHFEVAQSLTLEAGKPAYGSTTWNRIDPKVFLAEYAPTGHSLMPDPMILMKKHYQLLEMRDSIQFQSPDQVVPVKETKKK